MAHDNYLKRSHMGLSGPGRAGEYVALSEIERIGSRAQRRQAQRLAKQQARMQGGRKR
jgi:hypothetical protein